MGEKCAQKKKKKKRNEKIGQVRRSLEKKFGQSESERLLHREIWYLQVGFFFLSIYSSNWGDCNSVSQGENPWTPIFLPFFFSYQIHQNIILSFIFFHHS